MKRLASTLFIAASMILGAAKADACSNVLVTRGASSDGSNFISYAADSHQLFGELYFRPAAFWNPGDMRKVYDWDSGKYLGMIPQVRHTYQRVGNMNEHQLIIAETTYGGRPELFDSTGVMDYGSLIYIALERAKTAREAINIIADLANTYGYYSSGESFSIADKDEVWIMELIGKGFKAGKDGKNERKGIVWVARRVPDGYICAHANHARITTFPLNDPENCLYSDDVISFAREMGYFEGEDTSFSFTDAYAPLDFMAMRGCEARAWSAFNILTDGKFTFIDENGQEVTKDAYDYIDYAMGYDKTKRFPLFVKPARKITVKNVADVMRDHYEGTPMDMTQDIGAGGNALPYRWRPMTFKDKEGNEYMNERAIATQQTGFWFVGQNRKELPDVIGGIIWFGTDDAATSYLTPIYTNTLECPDSFREGNGSMLEYSATSAFWITNRVANHCYKMYDIMAARVKEDIDAWENKMMDEVKKCDSEALRLYNEAQNTPRKKIRRNNKTKNVVDPYLSVKQYLTDFSISNAQKIFNHWVELETFLMIKYVDGNIKSQNPDGSFVNNGYDKTKPDKIQNRAYTDKWIECVVKDHGNVIKMK